MKILFKPELAVVMFTLNLILIQISINRYFFIYIPVLSIINKKLH